MNKKQADRRLDEKPAGKGPGNHDPSKPKSGGRMPEVLEDRKGFGKPEGHRQPAKPGPQGGGKGILDGERSDRDSGRPVQLEEDDERQSLPTGRPGRADSEAGLGGRPQEGREGRGAVRGGEDQALISLPRGRSTRRPWRRNLQAVSFLDGVKYVR